MFGTKETKQHAPNTIRRAGAGCKETPLSFSNGIDVVRDKEFPISIANINRECVIMRLPRAQCRAELPEQVSRHAVGRD